MSGNNFDSIMGNQAMATYSSLSESINKQYKDLFNALNISLATQVRCAYEPIYDCVTMLNKRILNFSTELSYTQRIFKRSMSHYILNYNSAISALVKSGVVEQISQVQNAVIKMIEPFSKLKITVPTLDIAFSQFSDISLRNYFNNVVEESIKNEDDSENILDAQKAEFIDDILEISNEKYNSPNWIQRLNEGYIKWKSTYAIFADILICIITPIIIGIFSSYIYQHVLASTDNTKLKGEPSVQSAVKAVVSKDEILVVIDEAPYWYRVEIGRDKDKEKIIGWIPKRSVKRIETNINDHSEELNNVQ